jgi:subtilase family serine protease
VPPLSGGASSAGAVTVTIQAGTAPGSYFLIARADGADAIAEYSETNNVRARAITVAN